MLIDTTNTYKQGAIHRIPKKSNVNLSVSYKLQEIKCKLKENVRYGI